MAIFFPNPEKVKNEYSIKEIEKEVLNRLYNSYKNRDDIEIYIHTIFFNRFINIAIASENGIFFIIEEELGQDIKKGMKYFLDSYQEAQYKKKEINFFGFSNFEKPINEILETIESFFQKNIKLENDRKKYLKNSFLEIKNHLCPRYNEVNEDILIKFDQKQYELILKRENFKVKGTAGSGKTSIIVEKAILDYKKYQRNSLIVVFNITARNFIRQKLYNNYKNLDRLYFKIVHYHGIQKEINENEKFDNIFIDEAQDFKREWYELIEKRHLKSSGNIYIFGDEKQNIYAVELEGKNIKTPIPGAWNILKSSYRMENRPSQIAINFQKRFYRNKYEIDQLEIQEKVVYKNNIFDFSDSDSFKLEGDIEYKYFENKGKFETSAVNDYIKSLIRLKEIKEEKLAILATEIGALHPIMEDFLDKINLSSITTETIEEKKMITDKLFLENIRRNRKLNFDAFGKSIIFSTIHSFKGLERENIILVISGKVDEEKIDEIVYTGITRAKKNIYILNVGVEKYNEFFFENSTNGGFEI